MASNASVVSNGETPYWNREGPELPPPDAEDLEPVDFMARIRRQRGLE